MYIFAKIYGQRAPVGQLSAKLYTLLKSMANAVPKTIDNASICILRLLKVFDEFFVVRIFAVCFLTCTFMNEALALTSS